MTSCRRRVVARLDAGRMLGRVLGVCLAASGGCAGTVTPAMDPEPGAVALVTRALEARGARIDGDGTFAPLLAYVKQSHRLVPAREAQPGDVLFFRVEGSRCADHAGVVEAVEPGGRIVFREARAGSVRRSFACPAAPALRRAADGRILNSFLRPRRMEDPPTTRYFAGQLLCAVGRVERR